MDTRLRRVGASFCLLLVGCSGGGDDPPPGAANADFTVRGVQPNADAVVFLNDPVTIDFTAPVDLDSADLSSVSFQVFDRDGNPVQESVNGTFLRSDDGLQLSFVPRYPTDDSYQNGGFRPNRTYVMQLVGGEVRNGTTLRSVTGRPLETPRSLRFHTRDGTQPAQLFRNPESGGPRRVGIEVGNGAPLDAVPLGLFGTAPLEVRLSFDQALNPRSDNVPTGIATDPIRRDPAQRGNVWLEYDDVELGPATWIPAHFEIERNDTRGCVAVLRPFGVLPNDATIRVVVEAQLEDIAGESNFGTPGFDRVFATFRTVAGHAQQWNTIVEEFDDASFLDKAAVFPEPPAEVGPGWLRAGFEFGGASTSRDFRPNNVEVVLNTAFTQVAPEQGLPFTVSGGVFTFRNVTIPTGVSVVGQGPNPMVWLCSGDFRVAGTLSVRGGNGARVDTLLSPQFAKAGGIGVCGGGNGGDGSPSGTSRDPAGGTGRGPLQALGRGGRGGLLACGGGCYTDPNFYNGSGGGSGGGGGSFATQGDPWYRWNGPMPGTTFQQMRGIGGAGCSGLSNQRSAGLAGGMAGDRPFTDSRSDNDFWGSGINLDPARRLRITGELQVPMGGGGGGGGGDTCSGQQPGNWGMDYSGGGGGGGGGVLIVKALGRIVVEPTGRIVADGGHGGGGEQVGACGEAGGGGGGAGGMVVLMSAREIVIHAHGSGATPIYRYAENDYNFAISADGGITTTGAFGTITELNPPVQLNLSSKYPSNGQPMVAGTLYDANPLGGLGGMGIVQLMTPPGDNSDNTNTRLDDHITFVVAGVPLGNSPADALRKQQLLAWRGFANNAGVPVDDFGTPTNIAGNEGDIRPAPVLLPVPFGPQSRARSQWIDTGSSARRVLAAADGAPRCLVAGPGTVAGPRYHFGGLRTTGADAGVVDWEKANDTDVRLRVQVVADDVPVAPIAAGATSAEYQGARAYRLELGAGALGADERWTGYEAELRNGGGDRLAAFRILSHQGSSLLLAPDGQALPEGIATVRVLERFVGITTDGDPGLPSYVPLGSNDPAPSAIVRIGFAFHRDPGEANPLAGRFPADSPDAFVHDLDDPQLAAWIAANGPPRFVQWDVVFDLDPVPPAGSRPGLQPNPRRPQLDWLRLPFRW